MHLETHEKKWLDEEVLKLPHVDMSEGIDQDELDKICSRVLLALKFRAEKWEPMVNDPTKRNCNKYKKLEEYVYLHLNRAEPAGDQAQQSTQPTIEQSQVEGEASAEIPDTQQNFAPIITPQLTSTQIHTDSHRSTQIISSDPHRWPPRLQIQWRPHKATA